MDSNDLRRWDEKWVDFYDAHAHEVNLVLAGFAGGVVGTVIFERVVHVLAGWF